MNLSPPDFISLYDAIEKHAGVSFHNYAPASIQRRVERFLQLKHQSLEGALRKLKQDPSFGEEMVEEITVNVTEMFRDPIFFIALQRLVFPELAKLKSISSWHAGCSTGEEVVSTAILLKEHGLLTHSSLLGTDINKSVIQKAQQGTYATRQLNSYLEAYHLAGGNGNLLDYFTESKNSFHLTPEIKRSCAFLSGGILQMPDHKKFDMVMCRNTLIYFDLSMQDEVMRIIHHNLNMGGFLCLGEKETLRFTSRSYRFKEIDSVHKIYQKID